MKQPKKLTYDHKKYLAKRHYDPTFWMLQAEDRETYTYVNKLSGETLIRMKPNRP